MDELLEIYKLHSELADRVSQRRTEVNRLCAGLFLGLSVLVSALLRFGVGQVPIQLAVGALGVFGVLVSIWWIMMLRNYKKLNEGKFTVLHDLEKRLPYPFFTLEDEIIKNNYMKSSHVEMVLPLIFALLFYSLIGYAIVEYLCQTGS